MGMSTYVVGIKPPDAKWLAMKKVWDACNEADTSVPVEVLAFFGDDGPDQRGVVVDLEETAACQPYREDMVEGFEIDIRKLPPDVKIVRFTNSW